MFDSIQYLRIIFHFAFLCASISISHGAFAQNDTASFSGIEVKGQIVEKESEEPVALTNIILLDTTYGAVTNLDGYFTLYLPAGKYTFQIKTIGYQEYIDSIVVTKNTSDLLIKLTRTSYELEEIVIRPGENPAHRIVKNAIKNRSNNRLSSIPFYYYEAYNKTTVTLNNISHQQMEKSLLLRPTRKFLRENYNDTALIDSNQKYKLGIYISEDLTDVFYDKPKTKEIIIARRSTGETTEQTSLVQSLIANVDVYDNYIEILQKQFITPTASGAFMNYKYYLVDTIINGQDSVYGIKCVPKRKFDKAFKGMIYVSSISWAIVKVDWRMNSDPNINFVEDVYIRQEFIRLDSFYLPKFKDIQVDFSNPANKIGVVGRTATFMESHSVTKSLQPDLFEGELKSIKDDAFDKDSTFWLQNRHSQLERSDVLAYEFVEDLQKRTIWQVITTINELLSTGKKKAGPVHLGPYSKVFGFNPVEGFRMQLGVYTNNDFSRRIFLNTYLGYGFGDERFKYQIGGGYKFSLLPRIEASFQHTYDIEQAGMTDYTRDGLGLLNSLLIRVPLRNLNYYRENRFTFFFEAAKGLSFSAYYRDYAFDPAFPSYFIDNSALQTDYKIAEVGVRSRISFKEEYIINEGERIYTGTPFPVLYIDYIRGFNGLNGGEYPYDKFAFSIFNKLKLGRFGWLNYSGTIGKVWGVLPYPSLYVFPGSQSYAFDPIGYYLDALTSYVGSDNLSANFDPTSFNLMYYYEFVADEYMVAGIDHHFEGYIFNKLPGLRWALHKLKLKEVATARFGWGSVSQENVEYNSPQNNPQYRDDPMILENSDNLINVQAPVNTPYLEAGVGVENILRFIRVDFVWRLTHLNPDAPAYLDGYNYNFGVRFYANVMF